MASHRVDVGAVDAFADGEAQRVEVEGRALVVVRRADDFFALRDICSHQGARLSDGRVTGTTLECAPGDEIAFGREGEVLVCPWHGWEYDLRTGCALFDPEKVRVRAYAVQIESGRVLIELG